MKAPWVPDGPVEEYDPVLRPRRWPLPPSTRGNGRWYTLDLTNAGAPRAIITIYASAVKAGRRFTVDLRVEYCVYESPDKTGEVTATAMQNLRGDGFEWTAAQDAEADARQILTDIADDSQMHVNIAQWEGTVADFPLGAHRLEV
jgi:hypothetical protein